MFALVTKTAHELDATRARTPTAPQLGRPEATAGLGVEGMQLGVARLGEQQVLGTADSQEPLGLDQRHDHEELAFQPEPLERSPARHEIRREGHLARADGQAIIEKMQSSKNRRSMDSSFRIPDDGVNREVRCEIAPIHP